MPVFTQITAASDHEHGQVLYGLDENGTVWVYQDRYAPWEGRYASSQTEGHTEGWVPLATGHSERITKPTT